ncbi:MAG: hypothetical protein V7744_11975 [Pseudomonadales bacterium]
MNVSPVSTVLRSIFVTALLMLAVPGYVLAGSLEETCAEYPDLWGCQPESKIPTCERMPDLAGCKEQTANSTCESQPGQDDCLPSPTTEATNQNQTQPREPDCSLYGHAAPCSEGGNKTSSEFDPDDIELEIIPQDTDNVPAPEYGYLEPPTEEPGEMADEESKEETEEDEYEEDTTDPCVVVDMAYRVLAASEAQLKLEQATLTHRQGAQSGAQAEHKRQTAKLKRAVEMNRKAKQAYDEYLANWSYALSSQPDIVGPVSLGPVMDVTIVEAGTFSDTDSWTDQAINWLGSLFDSDSPARLAEAKRLLSEMAQQVNESSAEALAAFADVSKLNREIELNQADINRAQRNSEALQERIDGARDDIEYDGPYC